MGDNCFGGASVAARGAAYASNGNPDAVFTRVGILNILVPNTVLH